MAVGVFVHEESPLWFYSFNQADAEPPGSHPGPVSSLNPACALAPTVGLAGHGVVLLLF